MKQRKHPTRKEKIKKYKTIENWSRARKEEKRKARGEKLNKELNYNKRNNLGGG